MPTDTQPQWPRLASPSIAAAVNQLSFVAREFFEERAGMHQFDGGLSRSDAEALALTQTNAIYAKKTDGEIAS